MSRRWPMVSWELEEAARSKLFVPRVDGVGEQPQYDARRCFKSAQIVALRAGRGPQESLTSPIPHAIAARGIINEQSDQHTSVLADARHTRAVRGGRNQAATGRTVLQRSQTRAFGFGFSKVHAVQTQAPPMVGTGASGAGAASAAAA